MAASKAVGSTVPTYRWRIYMRTFMWLSSVWTNAKFIRVIWCQMQRRAVSQYELNIKFKKKLQCFGTTSAKYIKA